MSKVRLAWQAKFEEAQGTCTVEVQAGWSDRGNCAKLARTHLRTRDGQGPEPA